MKKFYFLLLAILFFGIRSNAQPGCATDEYHAYKMEHDSVYKINYLQQLQVIRESYARQRNNPNQNPQSVIHIPTVVHVIHVGEPLGTGSNIPDAQIISAMNGLNDRFRGLIDSTIDIGIDFCLATRDPNGCLTNGITRIDGSSVTNYASSGVGFTNCGADQTTLLNLARWPETDYYNIYLVWNICSGAVGYSMGISAVPYSGIVMLSSIMVYSSTTLTHETGHGLWLSHTFAGDAGNLCPVDNVCTWDGDGICDTPPHRTGDCGSTNPCTPNGVWDNSRYNYMSYCGNRIKFTPDQRTMMNASANNNTQLLASQGCVTPLFNPFTIVANNMSCHNVCDGSVSISQVTACVPQSYTYAWSTGATTSSITGLCAGTYSVVITNTNSQTVSYTFTIVNPAVISVTTSISPGGCSANAVATVTGGTPFVSQVLCSSGSVTATIGTGTYAGQPTFYPTIYGNMSMGVRNQVLILASELTAAGLVAGNINALGFNVVSVLGASTLDGFNVKMKHTTQTNISYLVFGCQAVMNPQNITVTNGWNTHAFDIPFAWDGVSNIIIECCYNNSTTSAQNTQCYMTPTSFNSIAFNPANSMNVCNDFSNMSGSTYRPNLRLTQCLDSLVYNYQWSDGQTTSTATGLSPGTYTVTVTDANGCTGTSICTVTNANVNPVIVTATTISSLCSSDAVSTVTGGTPSPSPNLCGSGSSVITIGTGTHLVSPTNYPAVYGNYFWGGRHQVLMLASELTAAGLAPGKITALAFNVYTVLGTSTLNNFTVQMKHTSSPAMTVFETGLQVVMNPQTINITTGWNTHNFDTPFIWDGVSNVLVEVCFNNTTSVSQNSQIYMTFTPFNSVMYNISDNSTACSDLSNQWTTTARPNMRLTHCPDSLVYNYQWSDGQTTPTATGLTSGTYTLTVTDGNGCIGTTSVTINTGSTINAGNDTTILPMNPVTLGGNPTATGAAPFSYNWSPPAGLSSTTIANPVASVSVTTTYVLTTTDANGCTYLDTTVVIVDPLLSAQQIKVKGDFIIFPNPAQNILSVSASGIANGNYSISITNILGQVSWQKQVVIKDHVMQEEIRLDNLSAGIYFISIRNENALKVLRLEKLD